MEINKDLRRIHRFIAYFIAFVIIYFLVVNGFVIKVFSKSDYFRTSLPVTVLGAIVDNGGVFSFVIVFQVLDRIFSNINDRVVIALGNASDDYLIKNYGFNALALRMMLKTLNIILRLMRYANVVVFMRSQLSFALAIVITDVLVSTCFTISAMYTKNIVEFDYWRQFLPEILFVQVFLIPSYVLVIYVCNPTDYFNVGPPLTVFGSTVDSMGGYVALFVFVFFDHILATFVRDNADAWVSNVIMNRAEISHSAREDVLDDDGFFSHGREYAAWFGFSIYAAREIIDWIRDVFLVRLLFSQYFVISIYIVAEIVGSLISIYRRYNKDGNTSLAYNDTFKPGSTRLMVFLVSLQVVETIGLIMFFSLSGRSNSYLTFNNPLYFNVPLGSDIQVRVLISLTVFMQIARTLYECVIKPDFYHYIYNSHDENRRYLTPDSWGRTDGLNDEVIATTAITSFGNWIVYLFYLELITAGSIKFTVIMAAVDIPLRLTIIWFYIYKKSRLITNLEYVHVINENFDNIATIRTGSTANATNTTNRTRKERAKEMMKELLL